LRRFWYLPRLIASAVTFTLLISALLALVLAWRAAQSSVDNSARRAVLNAERMIDRTSQDLQKLDALTLLTCDPEVVSKLKDALYSSTSQIREIGLIRNKTLYCTNFGPVSLDMTPVAEALVLGTHITAGPNAVVPNNVSLFVYVSRQPERTVNAALNPTLMAEFERSSPLSGRAYLELRYTGPTDNGPREIRRDGKSELVYGLGQREVGLTGGSTMDGIYTSSRFPIFAEVKADSGIFWDEYWPLASHLFAVLLPLCLITAFVLDRLLASGALQRARYKQAIRRSQFQIYYQPIVSAQTRRLIGVEALLRWDHPKRGLLRAAQFAELFSDPAMDEPVARFVLQTVARDFKTAPVLASHLWCSVNIAPALLEKPSFASDVAKHAKNLLKGQLKVEITERTPVTPTAELAIRELRGLGIQVGLDDFGTGYSNINQLQTLAYDFIKIDGLLIRGIQSIDGISPVLDSVITMADRLGTEVVAEGVETITQAQALSTRKVKSLQGYLFSQAVPFSEIIQIVETEHAVSLTPIH
jgi:sensor c-di-GMP phosphodiesterase-like protein